MSDKVLWRCLDCESSWTVREAARRCCNTIPTKYVPAVGTKTEQLTPTEKHLLLVVARLRGLVYTLVMERNTAIADLKTQDLGAGLPFPGDPVATQSQQRQILNRASKRKF